jgi:predicted phage baseplate assembly protein
MSVPAPLIDKRSFNDLVAQTEALLQRYSGWRPAADGHDAGRALVRIFARLTELVIDRLNQVPDKNFLAFLNLMGLELLPPQPARVPLTFQLATGSTTDALVPAHTLVAAIPAEGETEPIVFEIERALVVTRSQLVAAFTREPAHDRYSDHTAIAAGAADGTFPVFQGDQAIPHVLYLGHSGVFGIDVAKTITLRFTPAEGEESWLSAVAWAYWDGTAWNASLTVSAPIPVNGSWEVTLSDMPLIPATRVGGHMSAWLRGRLLTPLPRGEVLQGEGAVRQTHLPCIDTIQTSIRIHRSGLLPDLAFTNQLPVDLTKDFFPFGEKPKFNDTLYLASDEAFSKPNAVITLMVALTNPADDERTPLPARPDPSGKLTLSWEFWNGRRWDVLGESGPGAQPPSEGKLTDESSAFTSRDQTERNVTFTCPAIAPADVNGQIRHWLRVRIARGDYGVEARYEPVRDQEGNIVTDPTTKTPIYQLTPATFRPPSVKSITLGYVYESPLEALEYTLTDNDFVIADHSQTAQTSGQMFTPYTPMSATQPTLYLAFQRPGESVGFAHRSTALYFRVAEVMYGELPAEGQAVAAPAAVVWEYWNGSRWARLSTSDETQAFTRRGLITFIGPPDFQASTEFGLRAFWLRVCLHRGGYIRPPQLRRVLTNTMWAAHTLTVQNEILGSSIGEPNQVLRSRKAPVLPGQRVEVREPEMPSTAERAAIEREEGADAITTVLDPGGRPVEIWVRWHQVPDFYESEPRSRHYMLDRLTGEIRFGDGKRGLVPPRGRANVRAARYQTGGGSQGNQPVGAITQLKSAVPYVDRVSNQEPSGGGSAQETLEAVKIRGPKALRHRNRAVAIADFEDLAFEVSPEVARVKGIAAQGGEGAGGVGLIVVPSSHAPQPIPSMELLSRVEDYIRARLGPTVDLWVAGPDWLRVAVTAEVVPISPEAAGNVQVAVLTRLAAFLHPLTGGLDKQGWAFGRKPYRSDLYALVEGTRGVDRVRWLTVAEECGVRPDRFLVYSGDHQITMVDGNGA